MRLKARLNAPPVAIEADSGTLGFWAEVESIRSTLPVEEARREGESGVENTPWYCAIGTRVSGLAGLRGDGA